MFEKPSLTRRIAIGKAAGLVIGVTGFFLLPALYPEADILLRWGILLWYTTLGAVIGLVGVYGRHPLFDLPFPWWVRDPLVGAWMNFVLTFFAYEQLAAILAAVFGPVGVSPFWYPLDGAIVGGIIGYFATRFGGEGAETA